MHAGTHYHPYFPYVRWLFWQDHIKILIEHGLLWSKVNNIWSDHISFIWTVRVEETKWKNITKVWTFFQIILCAFQHKIIMSWNFYAWYFTGLPERIKISNANTEYSGDVSSTAFSKTYVILCSRFTKFSFILMETDGRSPFEIFP